MADKLIIRDLIDTRQLNSTDLCDIRGGLASSFLFGAMSGVKTPSVVFNIGNFEVNNFDITNNIDKLIQQTNNQLQLSQITVEAGDGADINVLSDQGLNGSNSSNA